MLLGLSSKACKHQTVKPNFIIHYGTKKLRTPKDFLKSNTNIK